MINGRKLTTLFLLLLALGFSGWLYLRSLSNQKTRPIDQATHANAFGKEIYTTNFDATGKIASILYTPKLLHYQKDNRSFFIKPRITVYNQGQKPWNITANFGHALYGSEVITFWDQVKLHQNTSSDTPATTITTSRLTYVPKKQFAMTQKPIKLVQPGSIVSSVGMQAYLNQDRVELLSHAKGQYNIQ